MQPVSYHRLNWRTQLFFNWYDKLYLNLLLYNNGWKCLVLPNTCISAVELETDNGFCFFCFTGLVFFSVNVLSSSPLVCHFRHKYLFHYKTKPGHTIAVKQGYLSLPQEIRTWHASTFHRGETGCSRGVQNSFAATTSAILFWEWLQVLSSFGISYASEN